MSKSIKARATARTGYHSGFGPWGGRKNYGGVGNPLATRTGRHRTAPTFMFGGADGLPMKRLKTTKGLTEWYLKYGVVKTREKCYDNCKHFALHHQHPDAETAGGVDTMANKVPFNRINVDGWATREPNNKCSDDPVPGFTLNKKQLTINESGTDNSAKFTVKLNTEVESLKQVILSVISLDTSGVTVNKNTLTFDTNSWNTPQEVTVTAVDNTLVDGNIVTKVIVLLKSSTDTNYKNLPHQTVTVTRMNDDKASFNITPTGPLDIDDATTGTFNVVLNKEPVGTVTLDITSNNTDIATVDKSLLIFNRDGWDTPQTVTVTKVAGAGSGSAVINIEINNSATHKTYQSAEAQTVNVTVS